VIADIDGAVLLELPVRQEYAQRSGISAAGQ
jgi:hypothetical protein